MNNIDTSLLALLRAAAMGSSPPCEIFDNMTEDDWRTLYQLAVDGGVVAVAYDGMLRLPSSWMPPRKLRLAWAATVEHIEQKYAHAWSVATDLAGRFGEHGIRMLVMKGLGLSQYYPIPSRREFGDIDIYLFGEKEQGDKLFKLWGAKKNLSSDKHSSFTWQGLLIENHDGFMDMDGSALNRDLNVRLKKIVETDHGFTQAGQPLFPSVDFTTLFFMAHAVQHYVTDHIVWRYFCDWAMILRGLDGKWDMQAYEEALGHAGFRSFADAVTAVTVNEWGLPPGITPSFERQPELEARLRKERLLPKTLPGKDMPVLRLIIFKYRRLMARRWKYKLIYGNFRRMIIRSALYHLRYPQSILWKK
ncbi:nucleotidyltransferase family protein [Dysgonomonas reticulitermitis]